MEKNREKNKIILNRVLTVVQVVLIVVCMIASIAIIQNPSRLRKDPKDCNTNIMVVMSDSMEPTFGSNAMIFGSGIEKASTTNGILDLGEIVTFAVDTGAGYYLNTHRIVGYVYWGNTGTDSFFESKVYFKKNSMETYDDFVQEAAKHPSENWILKGYVTRGDKYTLMYGGNLENDYAIYYPNNEVDYSKDDSDYRINEDILAVWKGGKIEAFGAVVKFLQTPLYFALCILLPLVALFIYNIVLVVRMIIADKSEKAKKQALEELSAQGAIDEEEIKRKAIEEYLARQAQEQNNKPEEEENNEE